MARDKSVIQLKEELITDHCYFLFFFFRRRVKISPLVSPHEQC